MSENFILRYRNDIYFGQNILEQALQETLRNIPGRRTLIVTGRRSAKISGALDRIIRILQDLKIEYDIADYVQPNPSLVIAEQVLEQC
ncbi:MAG: iron-containing alcohol dehydrogenase, partial [Crenarchaeota archaeon]|nr:iron-containing alcohol dehydrogenase [Thermoproteota archaeon]